MITEVEGTFIYGPVKESGRWVQHAFGFLSGEGLIHTCRDVEFHSGKLLFDQWVSAPAFIPDDAYADPDEGWRVALAAEQGRTFLVLHRADNPAGVAVTVALNRRIPMGGPAYGSPAVMAFPRDIG